MKDMAERFTYDIAISIVPHWECQTSTGVGALAMDGIGSSACHAWRPISPSLNFCNFSFKRKVNEYRMYDPVMSSFLSVDRYVQNPSNSQNFNRYSYCLNNPLKYTDPSGWQCRPTPPVSKIDWLSRPMEPRDFREGSPFMVNYALNGVDCSGGIAGGFGGGGGSNSYGYCYNFCPSVLCNPDDPRVQARLIWDFIHNPCYMTNKALRDAGIDKLNISIQRGTVGGEDGYRNANATWEYQGETHTCSELYYYDGGETNASNMSYTLSNQGLTNYGERNTNLIQGTVMSPAAQEQIGFHTTTTSSVAGIVDIAAKLANDGTTWTGTLNGISRTASWTGRILGIVGLTPSVINILSDFNYENTARLIIPGVAVGLTFVAAPWAAVASLGITLVDACGGFDGFYERVGRLDNNP